MCENHKFPIISKKLIYNIKYGITRKSDNFNRFFINLFKVTKCPLKDISLDETSYI